MSLTGFLVPGYVCVSCGASWLSLGQSPHWRCYQIGSGKLHNKRKREWNNVYHSRTFRFYDAFLVAAKKTESKNESYSGTKSSGIIFLLFWSLQPLTSLAGNMIPPCWLSEWHCAVWEIGIARPSATGNRSRDQSHQFWWFCTFLARGARVVPFSSRISPRLWKAGNQNWKPSRYLFEGLGPVQACDDAQGIFFRELSLGLGRSVCTLLIWATLGSGLLLLLVNNTHHHDEA